MAKKLKPSTYWSQEIHGATLRGTFISLYREESKFRNPDGSPRTAHRAIIETPTEKVMMPSHSTLVSLFRGTPPPMEVEVSYHGKRGNKHLWSGVELDDPYEDSSTPDDATE